MATIGELLETREKEIRLKSGRLCLGLESKYKISSEDMKILAEQLKENFVEGFKMGELVKKIKEK